MQFRKENFNFSFFLSAKTKVTSLEEGAKKYGGATKIKNEVYSNYDGGDLIEINDTSNEISLFVPSTINVNIAVDNYPYLADIIKKMRRRFSNTEYITDCKGSWYSDSLRQIVYEDISIVKAYVESLSKEDIDFVTNLAEQLKAEMKQEGVTITINNSMCIV